jgi:hypothetical protein
MTWVGVSCEASTETGRVGNAVGTTTHSQRCKRYHDSKVIVIARFIRICTVPLQNRGMSQRVFRSFVSYSRVLLSWTATN